jgi:acyl-CoA reductase-like NAD-dependent aldehyde dehydrogenase
MLDLTMTINGAAATSTTWSTVVDPATEEPVGRVPDCTPEQLDDAMTAAQNAFPAWAADLEQRRAAMEACAVALGHAAEELGELTTREQGMPLTVAVASARGAASSFRRYAALELPTETVQDDESALVRIERRPVGVVAAIKPWNFPLGMAIGTIAPAFRAGCPVVVKPSPFTPLATLRLGEILRDHLPPGVLTVVSGGDDLGRAMTSHPVPRAISFTGSVAAGRSVNIAAAADLKRVLLELGGNDPAIVLDDVDPATVAESLFWPTFSNAGQICKAIKRLYVPESMHEEIVEALAERARAVRVGRGTEPSVQMGPINNRPQYERVRELVAEAVDGGATVAAGGTAPDGPGLFFEPTVLTDLAEDARIIEEEQFGPALPVLPYRDVAEAVRKANATIFGLGASVWSNDPLRAAAVATQLEAGTVWVNTHGPIGSTAPFQGVKSSGLGSANGIWSVYAFTDIRTVYQARSGANVYQAPEPVATTTELGTEG